MKRKSQTRPDQPTKRRTSDRLKSNNDAWISLYLSSVHSLARSDYDAAIDSATQALNLLDTLKAKVLDTYSAAYAMKGKFSKAMEAAEKMIECSPLTTIGYLRAGETLALQGKHKLAIEVYRQGAKNVPVENDQFMALKESKAASDAQLNKRVDFLAMLPVDIANSIINQLGHIDYRVICMDVSRTWRWVVADCGPAWRRLTLIGHHLENTIFRFVPFVGKHVHLLKLNHAGAIQTQKIIEPVFHGQLGNIRDFELLDWCLGREMLLMVLMRLGNSLTGLTLRDNTNNQVLSLQSILLACPRMERFAYHIVGDMTFSEGNAIAPPVSNLESLELTARSIPTPVLESMLQLCPHLQTLYVTRCTGDGLKSIIDHCPHLEKLSFNGTASRSYPLQEGLTGMQQLAIRDTTQLVPQRVIQLLNQSKSSLRQVSLTLPDKDPGVYERWGGLAGIGAENLKHITYTRGSSVDMHLAVATMIRNCRALESVTFSALSQITSNVLDDALLRLPNLKTLMLLRIRNANIPSLEHFLTAHARKGRRSTLRKITLTTCESLPDSILERLTTIETLQDIRIIDCNSFTTDGLMRFGNQLRARMALRILYLRKMTSVTDHVLYSLIHISSLQELALGKLPLITGDAVETVVEGTGNLKKVTITNCPQIGSRSRDRIDKKLAENISNINSMK